MSSFGARSVSRIARPVARAWAAAERRPARRRPAGIWMLVAALLAAMAPSQDSRPLVAELDRLVAAAKNPAPMAQAIALDLLAPLAQKIADEFPEPTARDRRTMAADI